MKGCEWYLCLEKDGVVTVKGPNLGIFVEDEMFLSIKKEVMKILSKFQKEEEFFEAAYKGAEQCATTAVETANDKINLQKETYSNFYLRAAVKMAYILTSKLNYYTTDEEDNGVDDDEYYSLHGRYPPYSPPKQKVEKFNRNSNICGMQLERYQLFKAQDVEKGSFDVTFDFNGKKLHAHKFMLSTSEPLTALISDRWTATSTAAAAVNGVKEDIKIETYSYDSFYQLLSFFYSGECELTKENALILTDMAEFFGVPVLKGFCDQWLSKNKYDINEKNIYQFIEIAQRYSLTDFMATIEKLFNRNLGIVVGDEMFLDVKKEVMEILSKFKRSGKKEEEFFEAVYKWALHRVTTESSNNGSNLQQAIKTELDEILSNIKFSEMRLDFVLSFIVLDKCFLFAADELYKILSKSQRRPNQEEEFFKAVCELAEKEVIEKQNASPVEDFNLANAIKTELAGILPTVKFHQMTEKFLTEFVAAKGILSRDDGLHAHDICVQVRNADKILTGTFKDDYNIFDRVQKWQYGYTKVSHKSETKQRFFKLICKTPTTPSTVSKMKGCEWYLCLEKDGIVTVKFHTMIGPTDYLIAELKPQNNVQFRIDLSRYTYLTATRNQVL